MDDALKTVQQLEVRIEEARRGRPGMPATKEEFESLASDLEAVWGHPETDVRLKKRIVRTLIEGIVVDVDGQAAELIRRKRSWMLYEYWCASARMTRLLAR